MGNRTQVVCLHEGSKGRSIDPVFINRLLKSLDPPWIRPWKGSNIVRTVDCGGRNNLIARMPGELLACLKRGDEATLMVWADLDDDKPDGDALKQEFWLAAERAGIGRQQFDHVIFAFAKDRIENWIEFLRDGATDEAKEGPRVRHNREAADAAKKLAKMCKAGSQIEQMPQSLRWSCKNWRALVERMTQAS